MELTDVAAERAVLAGIFQYSGDVFVDIDDIITSQTFTLESNQLIYKCLHSILNRDINNVIDLAVFLSEAEKLGLSNLFYRIEEKKHLRSIINFSISASNVSKLAAKIRKLEIGRLLIDQLEQSKDSITNITGDESIDTILGLVENPILNFSLLLSNIQDNNPVRIGNKASAYLQHLENNPRDMIGISSGFPIYDKAIGGGLRRKTVSLIGARPKVGKTIIGDNVALYVAGQLNIPVLNLDTEMGQEDHINRLIGNIVNINTNEIETGRFGTAKEKIYNAAKYLESIPYDYINISGKEFEEVLAIMRRWVTKNVGHDANGLTNNCLIIYDYLKLMSSDKMMNQNLQEFQLLGFQITNLHNFMVKYDVPCLSFVQLNRDGITKETTDIVSQSDRLVWLCSNFTIFKKKEAEEIAEDGLNKGNRKLIPIVTRHGEGIEEGDYIHMNFEGQFARITEVGLKSEPNKQTVNQGFEINDQSSNDNIPFE